MKSRGRRRTRLDHSRKELRKGKTKNILWDLQSLRPVGGTSSVDGPRQGWHGVLPLRPARTPNQAMPSEDMKMKGWSTGYGLQ